MKKLIIAIALLFSASGVYAQDYGHCNFGQLLSLMPETAASEKTLQEYQQELVQEGEVKAQELDTKYQAYLAAQKSGDESPRQLATRENELRKLQEALVAMEQQAQAKLEQRRNELLRPVVEKANATIEEVAKENGMLLIFDTSLFNTVLFAEESKDIMPLVKAKLGIED